MELASFGITVNCVAPGFVKTSMLIVPPEMESLMVRQTPVGKLAKPEDIANIILFLASDGASHITGSTLKVDGGRTYYYLGS
jgi:3-oxoacyl-[acyl-carrier protein] reductase